MSNYTYVCVPCRVAFKGTYVCPNCKQPMKNTGKHWRAPSKNNDRAWKRIEKGEWLWDRRRVRRGDRKGLPPETVRKVERVKVQVYLHPENCNELMCKHFGPVGMAHPGMFVMKEIEGTERIVTNMRQFPITTDMGG